MHITITHDQLRAALQTWEEEARLHGWKPNPEHTPEQVAEENVKYLWRLLGKVK